MHATPSEEGNDDSGSDNDNDDETDDVRDDERVVTSSSLRTTNTMNESDNTKTTEKTVVTQIEVNKSWVETLTFTWPFSLYVGWVLFM